MELRYDILEACKATWDLYSVYKRYKSVDEFYSKLTGRVISMTGRTNSLFYKEHLYYIPVLRPRIPNKDEDRSNYYSIRRDNLDLSVAIIIADGEYRLECINTDLAGGKTRVKVITTSHREVAKEIVNDFLNGTYGKGKTQKLLSS